jgi:hypothetical protein
MYCRSVVRVVRKMALTYLCGAVCVPVLNGVRACYSLRSVDVVRLNACAVGRVR